MHDQLRKLEKLCVIIPGLNEAQNLNLLYRELERLLGQNTWQLEIIFIDDGSSDNTLKVCRELHESDPRFQYVSLSRNFGHQRALTAGLDVCTGDAVVIMDADLQDPPEVVLEMIRMWEQGIDVVYGQRRSREGETLFKKLTAKVFYRVLRLLSGAAIPEDTGDFRLMDIRVVEQLRKLREQGRFIRGLVSWLGFNQRPVFYDRQPRYKGSTKYPFLPDAALRLGWHHGLFHHAPEGNHAVRRDYLAAGVYGCALFDRPQDLSERFCAGLRQHHGRHFPGGRFCSCFSPASWASMSPRPSRS